MVFYFEYFRIFAVAFSFFSVLHSACIYLCVFSWLKPACMLILKTPAIAILCYSNGYISLCMFAFICFSLLFVFLFFSFLCMCNFSAMTPFDYCLHCDLFSTPNSRSRRSAATSLPVLRIQALLAKRLPGSDRPQSNMDRRRWSYACTCLYLRLCMCVCVLTFYKALISALCVRSSSWV